MPPPLPPSRSSQRRRCSSSSKAGAASPLPPSPHVGRRPLLGDPAAIRNHGAELVGVFVDDNLDTMLGASEAANLELLQHHGDGSRAALPQLLRSTRVIYVLHVDENGKLLNHVYNGLSSFIDWILVDSANGGSGKGFNRQNFQIPSIRSKHGWLLAGGLHPENVCEAIVTLSPDGIDVSSGICGTNGIEKDSLRISSFMSKVKSTGHY